MIIVGFAMIVVFVSCAGPKNSAVKKEISVLIVGGGSSHDFDRWFNIEDSKTLSRDGLANVVYTSNIDSIAYYLPKTDVLYLSNNQPIKDLKVRQSIF